MPKPTAAPTQSTRKGVWLSCLLIALACLAAYHNSFSGPFIYDDKDAVVDNASIRHLSTAWSSPSDETNTAGGRPVFNFSLALSYALSRNQPWGFHALNLVIHLLAALCLFGIVRRMVAGASPEAPSRFAPELTKSATLAGFAVALLWAVHPLQTESVTYTVQRAESLMGLFFLLTVYCFVRAAQEPRQSTLWFGLSLAACFLGMGTKEDMATAPLAVLLFDGIFLAGSVKEALRRRKGVYLGLAASWIFLGFLVASTGGNRGGSIGFGIGVSPWAYALTQFKAIATYLKLSFWPHPLVFEYGTFWAKSAGDVVPYALVVLPVVTATLWALFSNPGTPSKRALGFAGAWFFLILAPTSSFIPGTTQMIVEHRMYLPLAAILASVVLAAASRVGPRALGYLALLAIPLAILTEQRNRAYGSEEALWADTAAKRPDNARAQLNYGVALLDQGRSSDAISQFEETLKAEPDSVEARTDIANALHQLGQNEQALAQYQEALRIKPSYVQARIDLGNLLTQMGRAPEGVEQFRLALQSKPGDSAARNGLGMALMSTGDPASALPEFQESVRLNPDFAEAWFNEGNALRSTGRIPEAVSAYQEALTVKPDYPEAAMNLGNLHLQMGQLDLAVRYFQAALRVRPGLADAHNSLGVALMRSRNFADAVGEFNEAIRLNPSYSAAHANLASSLHELGRDEEAHQQLEEAARLRSLPGAGR